MSIVVVLARPLYWKILIAIMLVLLPLSYLSYVACLFLSERDFSLRSK